MLHEAALQQSENTPFSGAKSDFSGKWINQIESTMTLTVNGSDVTGEYESKTSISGAGGGKIKGILKGYVAGDLISFTVLWPRGSITAWVGQMVDEKTTPRIKTLWHLVTEVPDAKEPDYLWTSTFTGADEFTRQAIPTTPA